MSDDKIPCPKCSKNIHENARFCRFCGHSMTTDQDKLKSGKEVELRSGKLPATSGPNVYVIAAVVSILAVLLGLGAFVIF